MRYFLCILFFIYAYFEISFFIKVADSIGVFLALICIIATSFIGFSLVKTQGLKNFSIMRQKMANHQSLKNEVIKNVALLFAGFFLLIPGFLTDILGVILLIPYVQNYLVKLIVKKMPIQSSVDSSRSFNQSDEIIEGEFIRKDDE
ncbi:MULTISPECIES: FxsA family protein [unclassified Gilliamella]|uniref:FxsA family protein n=1 Tax=unclassified Gilliamella TaxID=2685620 RepID=UPI0022699CDF|nr:MULTISPECIES: FxsA family protein [unclassified Gilliamella]MCX8575431.1 FxsA family protein [Gilliamella sp. B3831]MCX8577706.1 FxsA family protein [Gilliamella sp. B3815]MCX8590669.1 FxsA family protein [Gilliamella sp. B3812]MCX8604775.1 FxsA family protein [Gilliamella sp. B3823]MCX8606234.1 FxsA family protein [Gilliamella sp. B3825]